MAGQDERGGDPPPEPGPSAFTDIQRLGLRAAGHVIRRLTAQTEAWAGRGAENLTSKADVGRLLEEVSGLAASAVRTLLPAASTFDASGAAREVAPIAVEQSGLGDVTVWLHNTTAHEQRDLRVFCGELVSHNGHCLRTGLRFRPALIERLGAGESRAVRVEAEVHKADPPGTYRGTILVSGQPETWLPIAVTVSR